MTFWTHCGTAGDFMDEIESKLQAGRLAKYLELDRRRTEIYDALEALSSRPWAKTGPCGQGPFTGNTRESRRVESMEILFTSTRGGSPAVATSLRALRFEAYELGRALESMLTAQLDAVNAEMKKL